MTRAAGRAELRRGEIIINGIDLGVGGQIAWIKAKLVARYKLAAVPGRPEELRQPGTDRGVSVQYGTFQIRVRLMEGRRWVATLDLQPAAPKWDLWGRIAQVCDAWFGPTIGQRVPIDAETYGQREAREWTEALRERRKEARIRGELL